MESDGELEDGEIVDYTPLERPQLPLSTATNYSNGSLVTKESSDEGSLASSESEDSDLEPCNRPKKQKLTNRKFKFSNPSQPKKYNVWSIGLQEEALSETLIKCDVEKLDRSRSVESYDYQLKYRLDDGSGDQIGESESGEKSWKETNTSNKRRYGMYGNQRHIRLRNECENTDLNKVVIQRVLDDLVVTEEDSPEKVALDISSKLSETNKDLVLRIVTVLGIKEAIEFYYRTKTIEEEGGMMVMNGSRRRTAGGVYFTLIKQDREIPQEKVKEIFADKVTVQLRKRRKKIKNIEVQKLDALPILLTRGEQLKLRDRVGEGDNLVTNPPPSPATDCDASETVNSQSQQLVSYDDDFFQLNTDDNEMELF